MLGASPLPAQSSASSIKCEGEDGSEREAFREWLHLGTLCHEPDTNLS